MSRSRDTRNTCFYVFFQLSVVIASAGTAWGIEHDRWVIPPLLFVLCVSILAITKDRQFIESIAKSEGKLELLDDINTQMESLR